MMSLCHNWFGRDLSKNRGLDGFLTGLGLTFFVNPSSESVLCTLVALAGTRKNRLSTSAIRRGPYSGCFFFIPMIRLLTALFSLGLAPVRGLAINPSVPRSRYALTQRITEWPLTPNCSCNTVALYPSSRYRRTILIRIS
jgi:hypothetical protein